MIEPVGARVLTPQWAPTVIPAPYDSLTPDERAQHLAENPDSFAHVAGSPPESFGHPSEHLRHAARSTAALERLIGLGAFGEERPPELYVQCVEADGYRQHSLLGSVRLGSHDLRPHEDTQPGRVHGLAVHFVEVQRMSSPVVLTAPSMSAVADVIEATLAAAAASPPLEPLLDTKTADGALVTLWPAVTGDVGACAAGEGSKSGVAVEGPLYIVDGHHRVAAARQAGFSQVLVACSPTEELHLGSFDRELSELDMMPRRVVEQLKARCDVTAVPDADAARPTEPGSIGIGVAGQWFSAKLRERGPGGQSAGSSTRSLAGSGPGSASDRTASDQTATGLADPVARLDAAFVHDFVLGEIFGVTQASDPRLRFRPTMVPASGAPVTIQLAPVPLGAVFEVADFGAVMPPKTTYFLPKARSGLLLAPC